MTAPLTASDDGIPPPPAVVIGAEMAEVARQRDEAREEIAKLKAELSAASKEVRRLTGMCGTQADEIREMRETIARIKGDWNALVKERDEARAGAGELSAWVTENRHLRMALAASYCGADLYRDDGEMQDNRRFPLIDFLRDTWEEIEAKIRQRGMASLEKAKAPGVES